MWQKLRALPPYFGGKRRLLRRILKHILKPGEAPSLVDAFVGGGSVSLFGKARGSRVVANNIAFRRYIVGNALIENNRMTLDSEGVTRLFVEDVKRWLLLLLLTKYVLRMRPMGNFGAETIIRQAKDQNWEEVNQNHLKDLLSRDIAGYPKAVAEKLRGQVSAGVLSNGLKA